MTFPSDLALERSFMAQSSGAQLDSCEDLWAQKDELNVYIRLYHFFKFDTETETLVAHISILISRLRLESGIFRY